jgi:hypothetical protein
MIQGSGNLTLEWICSKGGASVSVDFIKITSGKDKKIQRVSGFCESVYPVSDFMSYVLVIETQKIAVL